MILAPRSPSPFFGRTIGCVGLLMLATLFSGCVTSSRQNDVVLKTVHPTVLLSGENVMAVSIAKTWLEDRGVLVVTWMEPFPLSHDDARQTQEERATRLQQAAQLGCHWVVEVQTVVTPLRVRWPLTRESLKVEKETLYHVVVTVQGTDPASGVVTWEGQARSFPADAPREAIPYLTSHALADALEIESSD